MVFGIRFLTAKEKDDEEEEEEDEEKEEVAVFTGIRTSYNILSVPKILGQNSRGLYIKTKKL
jgi:hypothetical protein